jgi:phthiocerol/phenolphthiocerol synthesis type-I polyketide synthase E
VIEARPEDDTIRRQIELVRELEARGGEILIHPALPTKADEMEEALQEIERRLGPVNGVFHAVPDEVLANFSALSELRGAVWQARAAEATAELVTLEEVLENRGPDFVLLESSLASALGGVGLGEVAALNHLAEAFAERHDATSRTPWTAVGWDRWGSADDGLGDYFLTSEEAAGALELALAFRGEPQVMVSSGDLTARVGDAVAPVRRAQAVGSVYARPELSTQYFAPTNETEERIAAMWAELLGIDRIGIHDDFFHLGGHSLLATQIVSRVREMFALELPLKAIFEAPTVAKFTALVEEAIIAEIDALTEEEALSCCRAASGEISRVEIATGWSRYPPAAALGLKPGAAIETKPAFAGSSKGGRPGKRGPEHGSPRVHPLARLRERGPGGEGPCSCS